MDQNLLPAFVITLLAGLATGLGSVLAFFVRHTNYRFLAMALAFSAGAMVFVSFAEILPKAQSGLLQPYGEKAAAGFAALAFVAGMALTSLIDVVVPRAENPHEPREAPEIDHLKDPEGSCPIDLRRSSLMRMGIVTALAIGIHNFPEGMATMFMALEDPRLGIAVAVAIALHNIPEGVSVSVPIYYATGCRKRAFMYSLVSGLAEPLGGILGYLALREFLNPTLRSVLFAAVAGVMVFVSLDELLPTARRYAAGHETVYGIILGMAVMAASLVLMK